MLRCPNCTDGQARAIETRTSAAPRSEVRRRRQCQKCGHRFTTYEYVVNEYDPLSLIVPLTNKDESRLKRELSAEALSDANETRKRYGLPPIDSLPK